MYIIRERLFRLGEDSDITDETGRPVLHVDGKVLSLHSRLILRDPSGREAGQAHRKLVAFSPTYEITTGLAGLAVPLAGALPSLSFLGRIKGRTKPAAEPGAAEGRDLTMRPVRPAGRDLALAGGSP